MPAYWWIPPALLAVAVVLVLALAGALWAVLVLLDWAAADDSEGGHATGPR